MPETITIPKADLLELLQGFRYTQDALENVPILHNIGRYHVKMNRDILNKWKGF